jgi:hypothetical protein
MAAVDDDAGLGVNAAPEAEADIGMDDRTCGSPVDQAQAGEGAWRQRQLTNSLKTETVPL